MKIGYARESGLWFPLEAKKKILLNEEIDSFIFDLADENNNFELLCENMKKGDSLIICGVDDIGNTKNEIEEAWRRLCNLNIEIYVLTAPTLFYSESMTLEQSFIRDVTCSVLTESLLCTGYSLWRKNQNKIRNQSSYECNWWSIQDVRKSGL